MVQKSFPFSLNNLDIFHKTPIFFSYKPFIGSFMSNFRPLRTLTCPLTGRQNPRGTPSPPWSKGSGGVGPLVEVHITTTTPHHPHPLDWGQGNFFMNKS